MNNTQISKSKIAKKVVMANLKFWGGDKVPALKNTLNFVFDMSDPTIDAFANLKIPETQKTKINRLSGDITDLSSKIAKAEHDIAGHKANFINVYTGLSIVSIRLRGLGYLSQNTVYTVHPVIASAYNININCTKFRGINLSSRIDPFLKKQYTDGLNLMKKMQMGILKDAQVLDKLKRDMSNRTLELYSASRNL